MEILSGEQPSSSIEQAPLPSVSPLQFRVNLAEHIRLVETPIRADEVVWRRIAADPLDNHLGREEFKNIDQDGNVVVQADETDFPRFDLLR